MNSNNQSPQGMPPGQPSQVPQPFPGSRVSPTPGGSASNGVGNERPVTLWSLLDAFRRRWIPCLAVAIPASLLVAAVVWQLVPAQFESSAVLKIDQYAKQFVVETKDKAGSTDFLIYRDSQINFLRSRPVLTSALRYEGVKETRLIRDLKYPVEWLEEELKIDSELSEEFVRIALSGEYPEDLAIVVNAIKDVYLDEVVYNERNQRVRELAGMKDKFSEMDQTVRKNQDRIKRLAEELGTGDPKVAIVNQGLIQKQLSDLQSELREIKSDIREEEAMRQYLKERGLSPDQMRRALPGIGFGSDRRPASRAVDSVVDKSETLADQLGYVQQKIQQFEATSRNLKHPDLLALKRQEKALRQRLNGFSDDGEEQPSFAMSNLDYLMKQKEKLEQEMRQTQQKLDLMGARVVELERENADIEHLVKARNKMAEEIANRDIELNAPQRIAVVQEANVPEKRNVKARSQASALAGFGLFGLIVAGFTMYEWFSHRIGSTSDIANAVNLRLIGTIPSPDKGGLLGLGIFAGKVDYDEWNRAVIESMDVVRTYLMRHIDPSRSASILITSASANEGKTTVSCQLAASLARAGKRVAIVDCDFRRPSAHLMLDGNEGPGICEYMRGEVGLKDTFQATQAEGLTFIAAGQVDQVVLQQLSADGGRSLIDTLKAEFDFVIVDTSPLLFVAEPSMLAQNADMVLLSTRKDYSRIPYVAQSRDSLRSLQVPLLGTVMVGSDSDFQRQSYGYRQEVQRQTQQQQYQPTQNASVQS